MSRMIVIFSSWLLVSVCALADSKQSQEKTVPGKPRTPAERFLDLVQEQKQAQQAFLSAVKQAKTAEERAKLVRPSPEKYRKQILALALENPKEVFAVDALIWLVQNGESGEV